MTRSRRPYAPRPNKRRPVPADFAARAGEHSIKQLCAIYVAGSATVQRWLAESGIVRPKQRCDRRPMPADFADVAPGLTVNALCRRYRASRDPVQRWLVEAGVVAAPRPKRREGPPPPRKRSAAKPKQTLWRTRNPLVPMPVARDTSLEGRAADHLRRLTFVFRCREGGAADPDGGYWRYGNAVLTGEELVERAKRHGFDPDEWQSMPPAREVTGAVA